MNKTRDLEFVAIMHSFVKNLLKKRLRKTISFALKNNF